MYPNGICLSTKQYYNEIFEQKKRKEKEKKGGDGGGAEILCEITNTV